MFHKLLVVLLLLFFQLETFASAKTTLEVDLERHFSALIAHINDSLKLNQNEFSVSPQMLAAFVDESLIPIWSSNQLLKQLFSKNIWEKLPAQEQRLLKAGFYNTLQRYVQEGFAYYDGQTFELVKIRLNTKQTRGYLKIKLIPKNLPSFELDFKIGLFEKNWCVYDVLVKGISYISMKKDDYRQLMKKQGVVGVLKWIDEKNKGFFPSRLSIGKPLSSNLGVSWLRLEKVVSKLSSLLVA